LTGKTSLAKDTSLGYLAMIDPIFIALPVSFVVTFSVWAVYRAIKKHDLEDSHLERCFKGI
jgi:hypothetical protein